MDDIDCIIIRYSEIGLKGKNRLVFEKQLIDNIKFYIKKNINEIVDDVVGRVRTPTPPLPDLSDPEVCKVE